MPTHFGEVTAEGHHHSTSPEDTPAAIRPGVWLTKQPASKGRSHTCPVPDMPTLLTPSDPNPWRCRHVRCPTPCSPHLPTEHGAVVGSTHVVTKHRRPQAGRSPLYQELRKSLEAASTMPRPVKFRAPIMNLTCFLHR